MRSAVLRSLGPLAAAVTYLLMQAHGHAPAAMAAVVVWMALWWTTEALPLAVTALLPFVLFPVLGIDTVANVAGSYGKEIIFLFLGGFLLALALERSGLHKRIAVQVLVRTGGSARRLVGGIMGVTFLLSMWVNSTSCVLLMVPIALSVLDGQGDEQLRARMAVPLLLAVSYSATIGGMATPISTPPNLIFIELWRERWPDRAPVGFAQWMATCIPMVLLFLVVAWWLLTRGIHRVPSTALADPKELREQAAGLGKATAAEWTAGLVFACTALLWVFGDDLRTGEEVLLRGWRSALGLPLFTDGAVAILGALLLFLLPVRVAGAQKRGLLTWEHAEPRVPWGVLLLFGAGFAIGSGIDRSGLADLIVGALADVGGWAPAWMVAAVSATVCLLSELGSNTATASYTLPVLARSAEAWGVDPLIVLWPATLAATLGFALPVSSPMQAIVYGTGRVPVRAMVRTGVVMDVVGVLLLVLFFAR